MTSKGTLEREISRLLKGFIVKESRKSVCNRDDNVKKLFEISDWCFHSNMLTNVLIMVGKNKYFFLMTIQMMLKNFKWCCHYNTTLHSILERRWSTLLISKLWIKCLHCQFKIANLAWCIVEWGIFRSPWYLHF